jgi:hypothetical protein
VSPITALVLTALGPVLYLGVVMLKYYSVREMFAPEAMQLYLTVLIMQILIIGVTCFMLVEAFKIKKELNDTISRNILNHIAAIGRNAQDIMRQAQLEASRESLIVDLSENAISYAKENTELFDPSKTDCMVCFEAFEEECQVIRMPCFPQKHFFHLKCIESWIGRHQNCPICRETVAKVELQRDGNVSSEEEELERLIGRPEGLSLVRRTSSVVRLLDSSNRSSQAENHPQILDQQAQHQEQEPNLAIND